MAKDTAFILGHLGDLEELAEEVLTVKQQVVDLDKKRNQNREAIRTLKKTAESSKKTDNHHDAISGKSWVCLGTTFMKLPSDQTEALLEEDQKRLDREIDKLRIELKQKVKKLRDLEGKSEAMGFDLKAMTSDEMKFFSR